MLHEKLFVYRNEPIAEKLDFDVLITGIVIRENMRDAS